jgi:hypothetical protein
LAAPEPSGLANSVTANGHAEFGLVEAAFADPDLVRRRRYRERALSYQPAQRAARRLLGRDL